MTKFTFLNVSEATEICLYNLTIEDIKEILEDGLVLVFVEEINN